MAKRKLTKDESAHMSRVAALGCIACRSLGYFDTPCEIHHINANGMGMRSSNDEVIGLCHTHHRTGGHGVAIHAGKKTFEEQFGTESALLELTRLLLDV